MSISTPCEPAPRPFWRDFILLPAVVMCVGWGLRGTIGGGSLGAMIPGALVALALSRALGSPWSSSGRVAAFGAVGVGFGGQETYGQTVGFVTGAGEMMVRGLVGLGVKGAVWGLVGGAVLGVGFMLDRVARRSLAWSLAGLAAGTWVGWWLIDRPRLLYFSNLLDRPRPELWAGLLAGGLVFLGCWALLDRAVARVAARFALYGTLGGGVGFALGGAAYAGGLALGWSGAWFPGWKLMEFTFGLLFGAALGLAAWSLRDVLRASERVDAAVVTGRGGRPGWPLAIAAGAGVLLWGSAFLPVRFDYTLAGVVLLAVSFASERAAWQIALTVTMGAFLKDVGWQAHRLHPAVPQLCTNLVAWGLAAGLGAWVDVRARSGRDFTQWALRTLLWTAVGAAVVRVVWQPVLSAETVIVNAVFLGGAGWVIRLTRD